jgi:bifunctional DNA-binding transcriptional regulator/antitoxin component of YhaV-PrlF toxin-antitoxin module
VSGKEGTTRLVRPLRGGQITIPAEFRKMLGIGDDTVLQLTLRDGELRMKPLRVMETAKGSPWLRELYDEFAPARQEALEREYSNEEINAAIDEAVDAVRKRQ